MNVLVIEDEPSSLKLQHLVMASGGYNVSDAKEAEEALQLIKKDKPAVILLDLALPGVDGLTLPRSLKADPATKEICIIAVTSFPERFSKRMALEAGCDAYITKPISTRTLPDQVAEAMAKHSEQTKK